MKTVSSNSARISLFVTLRVKRPSCIRVNSSSSSTISVRRLDSLRIMFRPRLVSSVLALPPAESRVSLQPLIAVRGVRSSWETEDINSDCIRSDWLILLDISLIVSANSPISSSNCRWIWIP